MDAYIEPDGCEFYCENCATDDMEAYADGGGEADTPQHCSQCGRPLENSLTSDGVKYVLEAIRESLVDGRDKRNRVMPKQGTAEETMTYYHGSRHCEIVRGWAEQISWYRLSERDASLVSHYLSWTNV